MQLTKTKEGNDIQDAKRSQTKQDVIEPWSATPNANRFSQTKLLDSAISIRLTLCPSSWRSAVILNYACRPMFAAVFVSRPKHPDESNPCSQTTARPLAK